MSAIVAQLNVSRGGMPKLPVPGAQVLRRGVAGDWQLNRRHHGGPDRAVCLYSEELYRLLRERGVSLSGGALGENFTTRGLDLQALTSGDRLRVGSCIIEITKVRVPCASLKKWHPMLPKLIEGHSGWLARVVEEGLVRQGDAIQRVAPDAGSMADGSE